MEQIGSLGPIPRASSPRHCARSTTCPRPPAFPRSGTGGPRSASCECSWSGMRPTRHWPGEEGLMRILVTGHRGYIGAVMVPMLLAAGHEVVGLDSDLFAGCTFGRGLFEVPTIAKDVRDVEADDVVGFDAVVHLAALANDPLGDLNPDITFEINHLASVRLARLAKTVGIPRFVFSSSCSNYGAAGEALVTETG